MDIWDLLLRAEIMAETPRSVEVFKSVERKKGHPLSPAYDIFDYLQALKEQIQPTDILKNMGIDLDGLKISVKELFGTDINPAMTVGEIVRHTQNALL